VVPARQRGVAKEDAQQKLREVPLVWIKYRDAPGEGAGSIDMDCSYRLFRARAEYLLDGLRECKAVTCRDDMIAKKAWN